MAFFCLPKLAQEVSSGGGEEEEESCLHSDSMVGINQTRVKYKIERRKVYFRRCCDTKHEFIHEAVQSTWKSPPLHFPVCLFPSVFWRLKSLSSISALAEKERKGTLLSIETSWRKALHELHFGSLKLKSKKLFYLWPHRCADWRKVLAKWSQCLR